MEDPRIGFAARLNEVCTDKGLPQRGRQTQLGRQFKVSTQAARKWLLGEDMPKTTTLISIASWAGVNVNWLMQGVGPKRGERIEARLYVLDEAMRSLNGEQGTDLVDSLRAKLQRVGKLTVEEPEGPYHKMLESYEREFQRKRQ